eukprot:COSAG03_NODE_1884_length_3392_cov_8.919223_2_plen_281_part_00
MQHGTVRLPTTKQECEEQLALLDVEIAETRKEYKAYSGDPAYKAWVRCALCMPTSGTNAEFHENVEFHEIGSKKSLVSEERAQKLVSMLQECRQQNEKVDWTAVADAVNATGDGCDLSKKQVAAHWYNTASKQNADLAKWFSSKRSVSVERSQKLVSMLQECRQQNEKVDWTAVADAVNAAGDGCDLSKKQVVAHWYDTASRRKQNADLAKWFSGASSKKRKTQAATPPAATPPAATPTPARRQPKRQCQTTVAMKDSDFDSDSDDEYIPLLHIFRSAAR